MRRFVNVIVNGVKKFCDDLGYFVERFGLIIMLVTTVGVCFYQKNEINNLRQGNTVQASKIKNKRLEVGTRYNLDGMNLIVGKYNYKNHESYVITTNVNNKEYYQVGVNEDKEHRTKGVTVASGLDEK